MVVGAKELPITDIIVGDRARKDMGNINELSRDISKNGQIYPILITENNELIDGGRRLEALSVLGNDTVICNIARLVEGEDNVLQLELSSNDARKGFTTMEKLALMEKLKLPRGGDVRSKKQKLKKNLISKPSVDGFEKKDKKQKSHKDRKRKAEAIGFSSVSEYERTKSVIERGIEALIESVESGKMSLSTGDRISRLPKDKQGYAIDMEFKYGRGKWWYYELPEILIEYLESGDINRDQCDGYMMSLREGKTTVAKINQQVKSLVKSLRKSKGNAIAEKRHKELKEKAEKENFEKVDIAKGKIKDSMRNVLDVLEYPNRDSLFRVIRELYSENEEIDREND